MSGSSMIIAFCSAPIIAAGFGLAIEDSLSLRGQRAEDGHNHEQKGIAVPRRRHGECMGKHSMKKRWRCCTIAYDVAVIISLSHQHAAEHAVVLGLVLPRHDAKASESHVGEVRAERARKRGLRRREGR
jgi:hypothetical protein